MERKEKEKKQKREQKKAERESKIQIESTPENNLEFWMQ